MADDSYLAKLVHASYFPVSLADPHKMLLSLRKEDQANEYVQKAIQVFEAIAADTGLTGMTALDRCARMAELALQAMGMEESKIETYFSNGARLLEN
jgi:hypothetical protein